MNEEPTHPNEEERPEESPPSEPPASRGRERSSASPRASSAASNRFVEDPGPPFDPERAAEAPEPDQEAELHALPEPAVLWEEDAVRGILVAQGAALHAVAGVGEEDWAYTDNDLQAITPPLTRILNRYPVTRAAAGTGDELAVVIGLGGYVARSWQERKAVLEAQAAEEPVPISGRAAPAGTGGPEQGAGESEWKVGE